MSLEGPSGPNLMIAFVSYFDSGLDFDVDFVFDFDFDLDLDFDFDFDFGSRWSSLAIPRFVLQAC